MLTDLTDGLLPLAAKHISTMDIAMDLIFSLFSIALYRDVPFCQPHYIQYTHYGLPFVLCVPVLFTDNARYQFALA